VALGRPVQNFAKRKTIYPGGTVAHGSFHF
jgi:hypothetical protein